MEEKMEGWRKRWREGRRVREEWRKGWRREGGWEGWREGWRKRWRREGGWEGWRKDGGG